MSWIAVGGTVVAGALQYKGQKDASKASQKGYDAATAEQKRQYDQSRQDQMPWLQAGQGALGTLQQLNSGDFSAYKQSPDYQHRYDQGLQGLSRLAAARGNYRGGGTDKDIIDYNQGMASQGYGDFYNRQAALAGAGQTAGQTLGQLGQNYANNAGNLAINSGNSQAGYHMAKADLYGQAAAGIVGGANNWYQGNKAKNPGGTGWYFGNNPGKG